MAARTVGVLSIDLVGNIGGFESSMRRATSSATAFSKKLTVSFRNTHAELLRLAGPAAAFLSVRQVTQYAQAWTELNNRLKLVTATNRDLAQSSKDIYAIAQRTGQSLEGVSTVYQRIAKNAGTYGLSLQEVGSITETVNKAVALSGASATAASAGLLQFGQSLASGSFRGDELNSVLEQIPTLAEAIAKGLDVPVGKLREMGKAGELSTDKVVKGLQKAAGYIDTQFSSVTLTAEQHQQRLNNALERYVGMLDKELGGSTAFGKMMKSITGYVEDQTTKINKLVNDIDFLVEQYQSISAEISGFWSKVTEGLPELGNKTDATASVMERSFGDFVVSTLAELQNLANFFYGIYKSIQETASAVGDNLKIAFNNAFEFLKEKSTSTINEVIKALNALGSVEVFGKSIGINLKPLDEYTANYQKFIDTTAVQNKAFEEGMKRFTFGDDARVARQLGAAIRENIKLADEYYSDMEKRDIDTGKPGVVTPASGGGKGRKGRAGRSDAEKAYSREQKQFLDWMKNQREKIAMLGTETELEKINAELKLGNWSKLSEAQQQEMKAMAEQVDKAEEYNEKLERLNELTGDNLVKEHLKEAQALGMAWQAGALSLDAYASRLDKLNLEGANERISRGMGTSQDMMQSILGKYSGEFKSTQETIADSLGSSFATLADGAGDTLGQMIFYGDEANASFGDIAKTIGVDMVKALATMGIQMLAQKALGSAINTASTAEATATGAEITSAMAPAAATASVATLGGASVAGLAGLMAIVTLLPTLFGKGFAEGGFTGPGGKYSPAGVVHAGEYVFNAQRVREIGLDNLRRLDQMGGFAEGGYVGGDKVTGNIASLSSGASTGELKLNIQTHTSKPLTFEESTTAAGERVLIVKEAVNAVAASLGNPNSSVSRALSKNTHSRRRF